MCQYVAGRLDATAQAPLRDETLDISRGCAHRLAWRCHVAKMNRPGWISRFVHWLFGAPFKNLPPEYGDTVPSDLRVFETERELAQHSAESEPGPDAARDEPSRPIRKDAPRGRQ